MKFGTEHKIYVLRLWRETPQDTWRLAIHPNGETPRGIPCLNTLTQYLFHQMQHESEGEWNSAESHPPSDS